MFQILKFICVLRQAEEAPWTSTSPLQPHGVWHRKTAKMTGNIVARLFTGRRGVGVLGTGVITYQQRGKVDTLRAGTLINEVNTLLKGARLFEPGALGLIFVRILFVWCAFSFGPSADPL